MDKRYLSPTLDKLKPVVADLPEPFTIKDIMAASGIPENPVRAALSSMKNRDWVENTGLRLRSGKGFQALWVRTRWFGIDRASASADMQRAGLERLGQCMAGWRAA